MVSIPTINEDDIGSTSDLINAVNYSLQTAQAEINRELIRIEGEAQGNSESSE